MMIEDNSVLNYSEKYTGFGLAILPLHKPVYFPNKQIGKICCSCGNPNCSSIGKHPDGTLVPQGVRNASKDKNTIRRWFTGGGQNIGIATGAISGVFALDIDPRHGGDITFAKLEQENNPFPPTWRFLTGGGGEHILFRYPQCKIPNSAGLLGPGIDVRSDGGFIVAPPSLHASGKHYAITASHHPEKIPLADAPEWILKKLMEKPRTCIGQDWKNLIDNKIIPEGQRNNTIAQLSGLLIGKRIEPHLSIEFLLGFNERNCNPPLEEEEVARTFASIYKRDMEKQTQLNGVIYG